MSFMPRKKLFAEDITAVQPDLLSVEIVRFNRSGEQAERRALSLKSLIASVSAPLAAQNDGPAA